MCCQVTGSSSSCISINDVKVARGPASCSRQCTLCSGICMSALGRHSRSELQCCLPLGRSLGFDIARQDLHSRIITLSVKKEPSLQAANFAPVIEAQLCNFLLHAVDIFQPAISGPPHPLLSLCMKLQRCFLCDNTFVWETKTQERSSLLSTSRCLRQQQKNQHQ